MPIFDSTPRWAAITKNKDREVEFKGFPGNDTTSPP